MIETYLSTRSTLRGVVLIMDIRRIPGPEERNLIDWLHHYGRSCILVLTKTDKLSKSNQSDRHRKIAEALAAPPDALLLFSAKSGKGREAVWEAIERLAGLPSPYPTG